LVVVEVLIEEAEITAVTVEVLAVGQQLEQLLVQEIRQVQAQVKEIMVVQQQTQAHLVLLEAVGHPQLVQTQTQEQAMAELELHHLFQVLQ
jgi:hypothetical protein